MVDEMQENPELRFYSLYLALSECMMELFTDGEIIITGKMNNHQVLDYRRRVGKKRVPEEQQIDLVVLSEKLSASFGQADVNTLAFHLSIDNEDLEGGTKSEKIQSLVKICARTGLLKELLNQCNQARPNIDWLDTQKNFALLTA